MRRPSTARCAICGERIVLITFDCNCDTPGWSTRRVREYAHEWNGSIDSPLPTYHYAIKGEQP